MALETGKRQKFLGLDEPKNVKVEKKESLIKNAKIRDVKMLKNLPLPKKNLSNSRGGYMALEAGKT